MTLRRAITLGQIADQSNRPDSWASRFKRYDADAEHDATMYAWLDARGLLPPHGQCPTPSLVKRYDREVLGIRRSGAGRVRRR